MKRFVEIGPVLGVGVDGVRGVIVSCGDVLWVRKCSGYCAASVRWRSVILF